MKISDFSVERPVTIVMITLLVLFIGFISLTELPIDLLPELDLPFAVVMTNYSEAGPEQIESTVTRPIEESLATIDNVSNIISISSPDRSLAIVEFEWGTDLDFATLDMRENVSLIEDMLPDEADSPQVIRFDPTQMPIMRIGMASEGDLDLQELKSLAEDVYEPSLERIPGVASVDISGGLEREIQVNVNQERMLGYGLSLEEIGAAIRQANIDLSGGTVEEGKKELLVRTVGKFDNIDKLRALEINTARGQKVSLQDIASIEDTTADIEEYSYLNGERSLGLTVQEQSGSNTVQVARAIERELESLERQVDYDLNVEIVRNQAEFIEEAIDNVQRNILVGAGLAILVLLLFLKDVRSTLIIATAIPISVVVAFTLLYFADLTLNLMTLGGIALGVGMLVDNAIVVLENIYRHRQEQESRLEAAKRGSAEVGTAIIASTLTTAAVFLPIVYVEGLASQIFGSLALTVAFSLLASLGVALTLIPMLSSKLLTVKEKFQSKEEEFKFTGGKKIYQNILRKALKDRYLVVVLVISVIILIGVGIATGIIPLESEFFPQADQGAFNVSIDLPQGQQLEETNQVAKRIEGYIDEIPEVRVMSSNVGGSGTMMGGGDSNEGSISVQLVSFDERDRSTGEIVESLRQQVDDIPGADITVSEQDMMGAGAGGGRGAIEVMVQGADLDRLISLAEEIEGEVVQVEGTRNVDIGLDESRPEVEIDVHRQLATEFGFQVGQVASAVEAAVAGRTVSRYEEGGEEHDIRLQLEEKTVKNISQLNNLKLTSPAGQTVPLAQIADVELTTGVTNIERENQQRIVRVLTDYHARSLSAVQNDIEERIDENVEIPIGYTVDYGGEVEDMQETFGDLGFALITAIVLVYMVMASQFESLVHPFTIMFTVPLALIGAIIGLAIVRAPLSVPGIIGAIMLAGIVVNNAIVMIDYINTRRREMGESREEAILKAGPVRLRPIMMTTLTTVLALIPLALGIGEGAEVQQPMAVVVVGGLLFSTILTLLVLPAFYSVFDDFSNFATRKTKNIIHREEMEEEK